jgi:hypothetical protein
MISDPSLAPVCGAPGALICAFPLREAAAIAATASTTVVVGANGSFP